MSRFLWWLCHPVCSIVQSCGLTVAVSCLHRVHNITVMLFWSNNVTACSLFLLYMWPAGPVGFQEACALFPSVHMLLLLVSLRHTVHWAGNVTPILIVNYSINYQANNNNLQTKFGLVPDWHSLQGACKYNTRINTQAGPAYYINWFNTPLWLWHVGSV